MSTLRLSALGGFGARLDGAPLGRLAPRLQSMLIYLALNRGAPVSRQQVAALLWPESSEAQARVNLRKLLVQLRRAWPRIDTVLNASGPALSWRADAVVDTDVADFERALSQNDLERGMGLYLGSLLPDCFDEWIAHERERLDRLFSGAVESWISALEAKRDYPTALAHAQRLLERNPLNEATYSTLMRLHALNGDRAGALRAYQACRDMLQREFGISPGEEARGFHARLLMDAGPAAIAPGSGAIASTTFLGRTGDWGRLVEAWKRSAGGPQYALISGEAGIGKTRLMEEFGRWAERQAIRTVTARCYVAEGAPAWSPVVAWLRTPVVFNALSGLDRVWLAEVSRLLPELRIKNPDLSPSTPPNENWQRQRLFEALARALLSGNAPIVVMLDDLQWCDTETLEWLRYLIRFDARARLLFVGTLVSGEIRDDHPALELSSAAQRNGIFTEIQLDPLNAMETASLAAEFSGHALEGHQVARLYRETEGNPLFVVESLRNGPVGGQGPGGPGEIPSTIQAVVAERLSRLSPLARDLAGLAATMGREFTLDILTLASGLSEADLVTGLEELLQRRIIREQPGDTGSAVCDFSHDKIRQAAYFGLSEARRRLNHRRVAEALEASRARPLQTSSAQIAIHLERAGLAERAIAHYQRAAEHARRIFANADAIRYMQRAWDLLNQAPDRSPGLAAGAPLIGESLGDLLRHGAQEAEAREVYLRAVADCSPSDRIGRTRLLRKIGNTHRDERRYDAATQAYAAAGDVLGAPPSDDVWPGDVWREWIQLQLEVDLVYYWLGRNQESAELLARLGPILVRHGAPGQRASFLQNSGFRALRENRGIATDEIVAQMREALAVLQAAGDLAAVPSATFGVGFALLWNAKPGLSEAPFLEALNLAERSDDTSLIARCLTYLTIAYRQLGQVRQTRDLVARSQTAADSAHMPEYTALGKANAAWLAYVDGDDGAVREFGEAAVAIWRQLPPRHASAPIQWTALFPLLAAAHRAGDGLRAIGYARLLLDPLLQRLPGPVEAVLGEAVLAWEENRKADGALHLAQALALASEFHLL